MVKSSTSRLLRVLAGLVLLLALPVGVFAEGGAEATSANKAPVTLKLICPGTPQVDQALISQAISEYLKPTLNVTFVLEQVDWASWTNRNSLITASGEDCDLLYAGDWTGYLTNAVKGAFTDLTDMVKRYAPELLKTSYAWTLEAAKVDGKLYAIPSYQMLAQSRGFFLRNDLVKKYAPAGFTIDPIKNDPRKLEPLFDAILKNEPGMVPWYTVRGKMLRFMGPFGVQGGGEAVTLDVTDPTPVYKNVFETTYYKDMMKLSREWFVKGYINKDAATTTESAAKKVAAGAAFSYSGQTNVGQGLVESLSTGMDIVMFPVLQPIITTNLVIGSMFAVPRQSKNPERALQFIARLHTDKQLQNMIVYGIEGKHYVKKDAGMIEPAPGIAAGKNPYLNLKWMFGNQSLLFDYGEKDRGAAAALDKFNGMAIRAKDLGFTFNQTSVKTEVGAIANVIAQYDPVIASGSVDATVGLYDEFIAALKAAGVQKVVDEANAQLKAWTAVNKK